MNSIFLAGISANTCLAGTSAKRRRLDLQVYQRNVQLQPLRSAVVGGAAAPSQRLPGKIRQSGELESQSGAASSRSRARLLLEGVSPPATRPLALLICMHSGFFCCRCILHDALDGATPNADLCVHTHSCVHTSVRIGVHMNCRHIWMASPVVYNFDVSGIALASSKIAFSVMYSWKHSRNAPMSPFSLCLLP